MCTSQYASTLNKPSRFSMSTHGQTVTIDVEHSDLDMYELMDIFKGLALASGFGEELWKSVITELAHQYDGDSREDAASFGAFIDD